MADLIVPPDGPLSARIACIGQCPGKTEINPHVLKPFQGYSGNLLRKWWAQLNPQIRRDEVYVDNLVPYMCDPERLPEDELRYWEQQLHIRLSRLTCVNVIVPMGNHACFALIGKGGVKGASRKDKIGITSLRGSIYGYTNIYSGRACKVIPTLHPSALFQRDNSGRMGVTKGILEKRVFADWKRINAESAFPEIREPQRTYFIDPLESDVAGFTHQIEDAGSEVALAIDIETPSGKLDCVGFSADPSWAMVIPTTTGAERETFMPYIKRLCESRAQKVFQNGCVPGDVEVLTTDGWLRIDRFREKTAVAQWDIKSGQIIFLPASLHKEEGGMQIFTVAADHHRCKYTFNHRMVVAPHKGGKGTSEWKVVEAKEAAKIPRFEIPTAGIYTGGSEVLPFTRLLVAIQADAHLTPTCCHFNFKKDRKIQRLKELCEKYGVELQRRNRSAEGESSFALKGEVAEAAWKYFGEGKEWGRWILDLTYECRLSILDELQYWDGYEKGKGFTYCTAVSSNVKWITALAAISGWGARSTSASTVFITPRDRVNIQTQHWQQGPYRSAMYCLKTFTGYFLARSQGRTFITGNCFDTYWLAHYGVGINNWLWDLMYMHVVADPVNNHSLDFLSSIYLPFHRYWKDFAKSGEDTFKWSDKKEDLLTYNGMDACISRELLGYIQSDLIERGVYEFYINHVQPMFAPLLDISLAGIRVDLEALNRLRLEAGEKAHQTRSRLTLLAGEDLVSKSGFSPIKLKRFFHDTLKLPKQYKLTKKVDGKSKSVSLDAINLAKLAYRYKTATEPAQLVVDYRARMKELESWLNPDKVDADGYVRAQYRPVTEACRLASSSHPMGRAEKYALKGKAKSAGRVKGEWIHYSGGKEGLAALGIDPLPKTRPCKCEPKIEGKGERDYYVAFPKPEAAPKVVDKGYNLQNTKRELREIYVPDSGCLLLEIDQSQIEDRMCKMYTGSPRMVELANRHPSVFDVHTHNATLIFGVPEELVTKEQRFLGKITSHGAERGMTGGKLSDKLLTDYDLLIPPEQTQGMIDAFLQENWEIRDIFFPWVRGEIMQKGKLVNSWGAVWDVRDENMDEDLYRRGYSFPMQSEAACWMFNWGLIPVHNYLKANWNRLHARINIPRHDALVMSVPKEHLYEVCAFTLANLERPRMIFGNWLTVPATIKVGRNDGKGKEWKTLPSRDDFMDQLEEYLK